MEDGGGRNPAPLTHTVCPPHPPPSQLKPILSEIEYLQDQHLLLTVKSLDGYESYGAHTAAVPLPPRAVPTSRLGGPPTLKTTPPSPPAGECVIALKSMIGSTAQQFLTYLSHRGEETGNIRGSMKVRVPAERLGTRERLYGESWGWEMGGLRAPPTPLRAVAQLSSPPPFPSIPSQSGSAWIRTRRRAAKGGPR